MKKEQQQITDFMVKAQQATPESPTVASPEVRELRVKLIAEELCELCEALGVNLNMTVLSRDLRVKALVTPTPKDLVHVYDAILDLLVVTIGAGVAFGLELEPGWEEVHRSNMSKFIDGHRREDGKWMKGPSYSPAKLEPLVQLQVLAQRPPPATPTEQCWQ